MRKLLYGLVGLVVVIVIAILVIPPMVPVATYTAKLVEVVKAQTGRDLRINGPVKLSLFPTVALSAKNVSFSNAPGGTARDMAELQGVDVRLKLLPLLSGTAEVSRFVLDHPVIALEIDKSGRPNWSFGTQPAAAPPPPGTTSKESSSVRFADLRIVDGTISYLDQRTGKPQQLTNVDLTLTSKNDGYAAKGSAQLNGQKMTVDVSLANTNAARPAISGKLSLAALDLNPYLAPDTAPASSPAGWSTTPIDFAGLQAVDADLSIAVGSILYHKVEIGSTTLAVGLKDGHLNADLGQFTLYKGKGRGKLSIDATVPIPTVEAQLALDNVTIQPLLRDLAGIDRLSGTGHFDIGISTHGHNQRELVAALAGKGSLTLANGAFQADIIGIARQAKAAISNPTALLGKSSSGGNGQTAFSSLAGTYTIASGVIHNDDLKLASADVPITGAGTIDLNQRLVNYRVVPTLDGTPIPVLVTGNWSDLQYRPDVGGLAANSGKLLGKAASSLTGSGSSSGGIGSALGGLLGK